MKIVSKTLLIMLLSFSCLSAISQFDHQLSDAAIDLTKQRVVYNPSYQVIDYPMGDVAPDKGVCTDVVIRAFRKMGIDLQQEVHEDMETHFDEYPQNWGLKKPNSNIDHRRVPNLMTFFSRKGIEKPITNNPEDYQPGDIVCWDLGGGVDHIGLVVDLQKEGTKRPLIVHNIGQGQKLNDCLFQFKIIGHYDYPKPGNEQE